MHLGESIPTYRQMQFNGDLRAYAYTAGAAGYSSQANVKEYFAA